MKVRSQLDVKRKAGKFTGAFAPYGYKKSETEIYEDEPSTPEVL